jgi:HEAT repeat protein
VDAAGRLLDPSKELGLAVEPIAQALAHAQGSRLERAALLGLLGRTGSARAAASLLPAATSDDEYLRAVALSALGEIGPAGADAALLSALAASSFPIRYTAAMALRRVGDRGSIDPLLDRIGAASLAERETLAVALSGPVHDTPSDAQITRLASLIEQNEGAVKDALIEALAHVPGARGAAALAQLEPALGPPGRAKLAEALAAHAEGREPLLRLLAEDDVAVRANAIWSLGAVGTPADVPALAAVRESADISAAANAVAAVARIAARENVDVSGTLCPALSDERAIVLANALAGLRATHLACPAPDAAAWLLEHHASDEVRLAAARLLRDRWTAVAPGALARCAAKDPSGLVAAECSAPAARDATPQSTIADVGVLVVPTGETSPAAQVPFALVRADGLIRCGTSDRRGAVWETSAPGGPLRLTLPAVFAD